MFKKMFEKLSGSKPPEFKESQMDPKTEALIHAIRERSKDDPLVGAKLGGKEIFQRLLDSMKNEKGVHVESLLCALGALAGYSCQANLQCPSLSEKHAGNSCFSNHRNQ
ncbi:hypothetical protein [Methylovulum psychrotolerans]|uniref:hypothetical protein n=1 Tax=Methylovulum psychrotolerans TaxID=1704499 RepID=UPI0012FC954D|nr:hypothetical protein [Methylovulum psychrotolerans]